MRLDNYLNYHEAFRFYEQHLEGRITGLVRHGEQFQSQHPADWKEKILHPASRF